MLHFVGHYPLDADWKSAVVFRNPDGRTQSVVEKGAREMEVIPVQVERNNIYFPIVKTCEGKDGQLANVFPRDPRLDE